MPLKTKRWDDPRETDDGFRLLVCRYRPRALPKKKETWRQHYAELGPSKELHAAYYGKTGAPIGWDDFRNRYLEEMKQQAALIRQIAEVVAEGKTITLLCSSACTDASHCHRTLLKGLIEVEVERLPKASLTEAKVAAPVSSEA